MKTGHSELYGLLTDAQDIVRDAQAVQEFHERRENIPSPKWARQGPRRLVCMNSPCVSAQF